MNNYEWIKSLTIEEMAKLFDSLSFNECQICDRDCLEDACYGWLPVLEDDVCCN